MNLRLVSDNFSDPNKLIYLDATSFFLKELLGTKKYSHLQRIDLKIDAVMYDQGECFVRILKNKKMTVKIKMRSGLDFMASLITLAHECIHAQQFISKRLVINKKNEWIWEKISYGTDPYKDIHRDNWYDAIPWEVEAATNESELVKKYIKHYFDSKA